MSDRTGNLQEIAEPVNQRTRRCASEHDALSSANYSLSFVQKQLDCVVSALHVIQSDMKRDDKTIMYSYALEPITRWLEELANDECKPCEAETPQG